MRCLVFNGKLAPLHMTECWGMRSLIITPISWKINGDVSVFSVDFLFHRR